jgi:hypothetical protein
MRHFSTLAAASLLALLLGPACGPSKELQMISKMNEDERAVLGDWKAIPDSVSPEMAQLAKLFGNMDESKEDKPELQFLVDKTFHLSVISSEMTGTWQVEKGTVRLIIKAIDGVAPAQVEKSFAGVKLGDGSSLPMLGGQTREAMGTLIRHMSLDLGERYNPLTLSSDRKQLSAGAKLPPDLGILGLGRAFKKVRDGATGQMLKS